MAHRHYVVQEITRPFTGCVAPEKCNPASHGNVRYVQRCRCGAERVINSNQGHRENSGWYMPEQ